MSFHIFTEERLVRYRWFETWGTSGSTLVHTCGRSDFRPKGGEPPDALHKGCCENALQSITEHTPSMSANNTSHTRK